MILMILEDPRKKSSKLNWYLIVFFNRISTERILPISSTLHVIMNSQKYLLLGFYKNEPSTTSIISFFISKPFSRCSFTNLNKLGETSTIVPLRNSIGRIALSGSVFENHGFEGLHGCEDIIVWADFAEVFMGRVVSMCGGKEVCPAGRTGLPAEGPLRVEVLTSCLAIIRCAWDILIWRSCSSGTFSASIIEARRRSVIQKYWLQEGN